MANSTKPNLTYDNSDKFTGLKDGNPFTSIPESATLAYYIYTIPGLFCGNEGQDLRDTPFFKQSFIKLTVSSYFPTYSRINTGNSRDFLCLSFQH